MKQVRLSEVNEDVKVVDGKLFFGKHEVKGCQFIKEDSIASLYVVRVWNTTSFPDSPYWSFVTGFDLSKGLFWLGGSYINMWEDQKKKHLPSAWYEGMAEIEYVLDNLYSDTAGKTWGIFEEEDFDYRPDTDGEIFTAHPCDTSTHGK